MEELLGSSDLEQISRTDSRLPLTCARLSTISMKPNSPTRLLFLFPYPSSLVLVSAFLSLFLSRSLRTHPHPFFRERASSLFRPIPARSSRRSLWYALRFAAWGDAPSSTSFCSSSHLAPVHAGTDITTAGTADSLKGVSHPWLRCVRGSSLRLADKRAAGIIRAYLEFNGEKREERIRDFAISARSANVIRTGAYWRNVYMINFQLSINSIDKSWKFRFSRDSILKEVSKSEYEKIIMYCIINCINYWRISFWRVNVIFFNTLN